ncbi:MAG: hypothetical protein ACR2L2_20730 [Acidobacteriota bacterium]
MLLATGLLRTATNQRLPWRRAKAATSPIAETGRTAVSSQTLGMLLMDIDARVFQNAAQSPAAQSRPGSISI